MTYCTKRFCKVSQKNIYFQKSHWFHISQKARLLKEWSEVKTTRLTNAIADLVSICHLQFPKPVDQHLPAPTSVYTAGGKWTNTEHNSRSMTRKYCIIYCQPYEFPIRKNSLFSVFWQIATSISTKLLKMGKNIITSCHPTKTQPKSVKHSYNNNLKSVKSILWSMNEIHNGMCVTSIEINNFQ